MPNRELIHANEDTVEILGFAMELGLIVRQDRPTETPNPDIVSIGKFIDFEGGVFMLYRPEWIFGDQQFIEIYGGHNAGKYSQSPRINASPITLYLSGERLEGNIPRLGNGFISWEKTWLRQSDGTMQKTPSEVGAVYEQLLKRMGALKCLKGGAHTYMVLENGWEKLQGGLAFPPFDYVEWQLSTC